MKEKDYKKLINKRLYQVFLFTSNMPIPVNFAKHSWFVVNLRGKISRFDSGLFLIKAKKSWGNVHMNLFKDPTSGLIKNINNDDDRHPSKIIGFIEGGKDSLAQKMGNFIFNNSKNYPYKNKYKYYPGPNSNTFIQWILNKFPESKFKLPLNAFGKNFREK